MRVNIAGSGQPIDDVLADLAASQAGLPGGAGSPESAAHGPGAKAGLADDAGNGAADGDASRPAGEASSRLTVPRQADAPGARQAPGSQTTLRVPADKIDHLLDVAGEILQHRRRLAHSLGHQAQLSPDVADLLGLGERMLGDLKDTAVAMRTLPLEVITAGLPRVVRDLARDAGKDVEFSVSGADTELDRLILESLSEPLTHLLRNAVVHGIEPPAEREQAGKPPRGRLELRAEPRGSLVEVVVADDGRGVSPDVIAEAGREKSLAEVLARPGFSTATEVTDLAGRGVGLDAVKAYANSLGGDLEVRSEPGRGMEVILLLPLALALAEVLVVERGGGVFGVALAAVEEVVTVTGTTTLQNQEALRVRGRSLPVTDLAALLGATAPPLPDRSPGIVISSGGRRAVVTCDALLGAEEVVVKPLGPLLARVPGYLGASILGDGRIALVVEPAALTGGPRQIPRSAPVPEPPAAPRVLVVEDSFTVRELQRSILEAAGYPVVTARDGQEALQAIDRDADIALVVTDLEMPRLGGLELTRAIRASGTRSSLPVVIVTSHGSDDDRRLGIEAGADAYMVKRSFDQQDLLATVEQLVGR
jgi:two-component system chemotaxis sensor kinase CheA